MYFHFDNRDHKYFGYFGMLLVILLEEGIVLFVQLVFFLIGYYFLKKNFFQDATSISFPFPHLFSVIFSLSLSLYLLVLFEIMHFLDPSIRWFNWELCIRVLLVSMIVIIPLYQVHLLLQFLKTPARLNFLYFLHVLNSFQHELLPHYRLLGTWCDSLSLLWANE